MGEKSWRGGGWGKDLLGLKGGVGFDCFESSFGGCEIKISMGLSYR